MAENRKVIRDFKIELPPAVRQMEDWKEGKDFKIPTLYAMIVGHQRTADWWHNRESLEGLRQPYPANQRGDSVSGFGWNVTSGTARELGIDSSK